MPGDDGVCGTPAAMASSMTSAMNTEQCWPSDTPPSAATASWPSWTTSLMPANYLPCSSMKEPVPALQASFMAASQMRPPSRRMYFASCPPISKMVSTSAS